MGAQQEDFGQEPCNVCKTRDARLLFWGRDKSVYDHDRTFPVFRCNNCGLVSISPQPPKQEHDFFYSSEYPFRPGKKAQPLGHYQPVVDLMLKRKPGRVMDVGTGNSPFLPTMKNLGWDVFGTELDRETVEDFKNQHQIDLFYGELEDAGYDGGSFDVVTIMGVLEHVRDPFALTKEVSRLLKDDGLLCLYCFNHSFEARLLGKYWVGFDIPRHLYSFPYRSLEKLLEENGFAIEECNYHPISFLPYFAVWASMRLKNRLKGSREATFPPLFLPKPVLLLSKPLGVLLAKMRASSSVYVFARNDGRAREMT